MIKKVYYVWRATFYQRYARVKKKQKKVMLENTLFITLIQYISRYPLNILFGIKNMIEILVILTESLIHKLLIV